MICSSEFLLVIGAREQMTRLTTRTSLKVTADWKQTSSVRCLNILQSTLWDGSYLYQAMSLHFMSTFGSLLSLFVLQQAQALQISAMSLVFSKLCHITFFEPTVRLKPIASTCFFRPWTPSLSPSDDLQCSYFRA